MITEQEKDRIRHISDLLYQATRSIRILSYIGWPSRIREEFFANGARELPQVEYASFDPTPVLDIVREARRKIQSSPIDQWLERQAADIENSALMLAACGLPSRCGSGSGYRAGRKQHVWH